MTQVGQDTLGTRSTMTAGGKEVAFYRVNVYVNLPSDGMIQRVKISDSLFVKCNDDKVVTEIGKKY